jgi:hypothetical protein
MVHASSPGHGMGYMFEKNLISSMVAERKFQLRKGK